MSERDLTLREISDRMQIHDVLIRYSTAINNRDCDLLDTCFTDDAPCDYSSTGGPSDTYAVVRQWFQTSLSHIESSLHRIGNIIYKIDGEAAHTRSMYMNPILVKLPDGSESGFTVGGYYDDEYMYGSEGWKICKRVDVATYHVGKLPSREEMLSQPETSEY